MLVNELGKFVSETTFDGIGPPVAAAVKTRLLDLLGSALAAVQLGTHKKLLPLFDGVGQATVWGLDSALPLRDAALVNSFLSHSTYLDDGSRYSGSHPGTVVIPSVFALAETKGKNGKDLIAAIAAGYEVLLRVGAAIYPSAVTRGFQSTAILGALGSAAGVANMLGLDAQRSKNALAIACNLGVGLKEALKSSESQPMQVARSCEGGALAAFYAQQGAEGADSIIEEGFLKAFADDADSSQILTGLGATSRIFETYIKVHGGCRGNHAPVDVVQSMVKQQGLAPDQIRLIEVLVDSVTYKGEIHDPVNGDQAQFSVPFAIAVALLNGDASIFQYTDAQVGSAAVKALMKKVKVVVDKKLDIGYPDKRGASAKITTATGEIFESFLENAKGEPECPLSENEISDKFLTLSREVLKDRGLQVRDLVLNLENVSNVQELGTLLRCRS
jgi:2-methylcitrate dehydratase PrpD